MRKQSEFLIIFLLVCFTAVSVSGCSKTSDPGKETQPTAEPVFQDFVSELKLDMDSETAKQEVTVKSYVDGDTTHFYVPESIVSCGFLKARYLGIDTPESTGKIEEYGEAASRFTKETLMSASSIIIESDDSKWNIDSTGSRYLVWVWYRTDESKPYRNLNLEILQSGLAVGSSAANNRYGKSCLAALNQAKQFKLNVFSGKPDPDYYYGEAVGLTLKELRCNTEDYAGIKVAFNGIVTKCRGNSVYIEAYDAETGMYFGIPIYYGFTLSGEGLDILSVGNEVRVVGTVSYHEDSGTYQIIGVSYRVMAPDDPDNLQLISSGNEASYVLTSPETFVNGKVTVEIGDEQKTFDYAALALASSIQMKGLSVKEIKVTENEESSSKGAMTLTCESDGVIIKVRTEVLHDENGNIITPDAFMNKVIDIKGIVDCFNGEPQIRVLSLKDIIIN